MKFDFLLRLKGGGFLGLVASGRKRNSSQILEIPNLDTVEGLPSLLNEPQSQDLTKLQNILAGKNKEKIDKLGKERERLYHLTQSLINLSGDHSPKEEKNIESFCLVISGEVKREGLLTLKTIRLLHEQPIYVIADQETKDFLLPSGIPDLHIKVDINEKSKKRIMKRFFKERFKNLNTFHRQEYIFKKMDAMSLALKRHDNTFFLDADIVLCEKLRVNSNAGIVLSPHYSPPSRFFQSFGNGFFNAGYIFCSDKTFPKHWRRIYLTDSRFYEQQGMDYIAEKYNIDIFNQAHNVGWWRHEVDDFNLPLKISLPKNTVSFHLHLEGKYDFWNNSIVKSKNKEIFEVMEGYLKSNKKKEVISAITSVFPDKIA